MTLEKTKADMKKRMPKFKRSDSHKSRLSRSGWRKPTGLHNKIKDQKAGHAKMPNEGYRTPKKLRHTHKGKPMVHVSTMAALKEADKNAIIIISAKIGNRKRVEMLDYIAENNMQVLHVKDAAKKSAAIKDKKATAQKVNKEKANKRQKSKEQKQKVLSEKDKKKQLKEESKSEDKKDLDKLLTKKEAS